MPVHIDHIDTEIEVTRGPREAGAPARPAGTTDRNSAQTVDLRGAVLAVLESELDLYLRMRG